MSHHRPARTPSTAAVGFLVQSVLGHKPFAHIQAWLNGRFSGFTRMDDFAGHRHGSSSPSRTRTLRTCCDAPELRLPRRGAPIEPPGSRPGPASGRGTGSPTGGRRCRVTAPPAGRYRSPRRRSARPEHPGTRSCQPPWLMCSAAPCTFPSFFAAAYWLGLWVRM